MASSNNRQQSGLSAHAPDFVSFGDLSGPGVPGSPASIDSVGHSTVAVMQGSAMYAMLFCQRFSMTHNIPVPGWITTPLSQQEAIILAGLLDVALNRGG